MATLYEIDRNIEQLLTTGFVFNEETGEIDTTLDEQTLYRMLDSKFEDYAIYIKSREAFRDSMRAEKKNLDERIRKEEKRIESLKNTLLTYMDKYDKRRIETPRAVASIRTSKITVIDDEEACIEFCRENHKDDCVSIHVDMKLNKANIKKQIEDFDGMAHLETNRNITIK